MKLRFHVAYLWNNTAGKTVVERVVDVKRGVSYNPRDNGDVRRLCGVANEALRQAYSGDQNYPVTTAYTWDGRAENVANVEVGIDYQGERLSFDLNKNSHCRKWVARINSLILIRGDASPETSTFSHQDED